MRSFTDIELDGAVTLNSETMSGARVVQVLCTQVSGTSDGTMALYGSIDGTNWILLNFADGSVGTASPIASHTGADKNQITIVDALVATWYINADVYPYTRLTCVGTVGDNTTISGGWIK